MDDRIKQLWWDIQHYGEVIDRIDRSDYNDFYTQRSHKYKDEIYNSVMKNGELILLMKLHEYEIYSYTDGKKLLDRKYWLPVGLEIVNTLGVEE